MSDEERKRLAEGEHYQINGTCNKWYSCKTK